MTQPRRPPADKHTMHPARILGAVCLIAAGVLLFADLGGPAAAGPRPLLWAAFAAAVAGVVLMAAAAIVDNGRRRR